MRPVHHALDAFRRFKDEVGQDIEMHEGGYLLPAFTDQMIEDFRKNIALQNSLKDMGARIFLDTQVTGFKMTQNRITSVITANGRIDAGMVVNAAGAHAAHIAAMAGAIRHTGIRRW